MYAKGSVDKPIGQKGYLCGAFLPENSSFYTKKVEIAWISPNPRTKQPKHYHREADEITIVIKGSLKEEVEGDLLELKAGDFLLIKSGLISQTKWVEEGTVVIIIKAPSVLADKYPC